MALASWSSYTSSSACLTPSTLLSWLLICMGALGSVSMSAVSMDVDNARQLTHGQVDVRLQLHTPTCTHDLDRKAEQKPRGLAVLMNPPAS